MQFDGSSPLLVGGISTPIMGEEHFIAAIDDRNAFSSVTMVPNGSGEAFGAGGVLIFSTLQLNSVPEGSSVVTIGDATDIRSEEHTSELQSLMRISYAVFCLKKKTENRKALTIED